MRAINNGSMNPLTSLPTNASAHRHGLTRDLDTLIRQATTNRRSMLRWLAIGSAGALPLMACGGSDGSAASSNGSTTGNSSSGSTSGSGTSTGACSVIPSETAGPYPGDGSNSNGSGIANALTLSGIVRSDIRSSIAGPTGVAQGVPLTVKLKLVNSGASCASLAGYAIYLWHCDRSGGYSMYSSGVTTENYLRGVQVTDANGEVTFTTIFPGCYSGRWPHIHFEVYASLNAAITTPASDQVRTSQLALPATACQAVYATSGYSASVGNFAAISLATDNVFSDDQAVSQLPAITGDATNGYAATLTVGISA